MRHGAATQHASPVVAPRGRRRRSGLGPGTADARLPASGEATLGASLLLPSGAGPWATARADSYGFVDVCRHRCTAFYCLYATGTGPDTVCDGTFRRSPRAERTSALPTATRKREAPSRRATVQRRAIPYTVAQKKGGVSTKCTAGHTALHHTNKKQTIKRRTLTAQSTLYFTLLWWALRP